MTSELREGMRLDWDVPIPMDDGIVLRADVFRPVEDGRFPCCYESACSGGRLSNFKNELRGCGPFLHDDPADRPPETFAGRTRLYAGSLLLPVIPSS